MRQAAPLFTTASHWIFDLDNTLYPSHCQLFAQIDQRMTAFIGMALKLAPQEARTLQKRYYLEHGTTLSGLMAVHGIPPGEFLAFVHDIDLAAVAPNPRLGQLLRALPGRKFVFTNGSCRHAENVLDRVGIADQFELICDIEASGYIPKPRPEAYSRLIARTGIAPRTAVMFDDIARNLDPAHGLGMTTVWIRTETDWSAGQGTEGGDHVHFTADDVTQFLETVVPQAALM